MLMSTLAAAGTPTPTASAAILGLHDSTRVQDSFYVILKESLPWKHHLTDTWVSSADPNVERAHRAAYRADLQVDAQLLDAIAQELAATYGGTVVDEMPGIHMFVVTMPEAQVVQMAKDPRIKIIGVDQLVQGIW